jgi:molybdate transport system ATP-binding protein
MIKISVKKKMKTSRGIEELDVHLTIEKGEFVTLFGESGTGKTTLLRIVAGLTQPEEGRIEVDGEVWFDSQRKFSLPVPERKVGFVFQEYSLFPNMTVRENLEYALVNRSQEKIIDEWLKAMDLKELENQRPDSLSGGQKQRVALARALVREPGILLLDEPLSALDINLRLKLQDEILRIYQRFHLTTIFVSHDLSEVFKLSQRVCVLEGGRITKSGKPGEVFLEKNISGKFKFVGAIVEIHTDPIMNILTIQIGNHITKVVATSDEIRDLHIGDKVIVAAKAFNPLILKLADGSH